MTTLSRKFNYVNISATTIILLVVSMLYWVTLRNALNQEADRDLTNKKQEIIQHVVRIGRLPHPVISGQLTTSFKLVSAAQPDDRFVTIDHAGPRDYRRLFFTVPVNGEIYEVTVQKPLEDFIELFGIAMVATVVMLVLLLVLLTFANSLILQALSRPLFTALDTVKRFRLGTKEDIIFPQTDIREFVQLNDTLSYAITTANRDYQLLQEYTENAAHELQTPLAIIRSKLDVIIQDKGVSEQQLMAASAAYNSLQRLSSLNRSLLILAQIDNQYFNAPETIDVSSLVAEKVSDFEDILQSKNIQLSCSNEGTCLLVINAQLGEILLNNLFSNAIEHNRDGGRLDIFAGTNQLSVRNSSVTAQVLDSTTMYRRFARQSEGQTRTGLGLAIIYEICKTSGITLDYEFRDHQHAFILTWQTVSG